MKPKPAKQSSAAKYPSFFKFHAVRRLASGAAVVVALAGCEQSSDNVENPKLTQSESDLIQKPRLLGKIAIPVPPLPETESTNSVEKCLPPGLPPMSESPTNSLESWEELDPFPMEMGLLMVADPPVMEDVQLRGEMPVSVAPSGTAVQ